MRGDPSQVLLLAQYPAIPIVAVCEDLTIWISWRNDLKAFLQGASNQCIRKYGNFISWVSCFMFVIIGHIERDGGWFNLQWQRGRQFFDRDTGVGHSPTKIDNVDMATDFLMKRCCTEISKIK